MKKKVIIGVALLLAVTMLAACGGIPQEDYDAAVAGKKAADAKVTSLTSQLSSAKSDATKAKSDLSAAQSELATAKSDLETAESGLATAESAAASAKSAASSAQSAAAAAKSDLATAEATIAELEATIAELEAAAAAEEEEEVAEEEEEEEVVEEEEEVVEEEEEEVAELSFAADEYVNEEYGFSVKYPSAWTVDYSDETGLWAYTGPYDIPGMTATFVDVGEADTLKALFELDETITEVTIVSETATTTPDGTEAIEVEYNYMVASGQIDNWCVVVKTDEKWIYSRAYTLQMYGPIEVDMAWEIARSLTFQ